MLVLQCLCPMQCWMFGPSLCHSQGCKSEFWSFWLTSMQVFICWCHTQINTIIRFKNWSTTLTFLQWSIPVGSNWGADMPSSDWPCGESRFLFDLVCQIRDTPMQYIDQILTKLFDRVSNNGADAWRQSIPFSDSWLHHMIAVHAAWQ